MPQSKKFYERLAFSFLLIILFSSCARVQKVDVFEGAVVKPYESLGTLEVSAKACQCPFSWSCSQEQYKKMLDHKLAKKAKKEYGADAVINARYWPDLNSDQFPGGLIYVRGEMIKYKPFASHGRAQSSKDKPTDWTTVRQQKTVPQT